MLRPTEDDSYVLLLDDFFNQTKVVCLSSFKMKVGSILVDFRASKK